MMTLNNIKAVLIGVIFCLCCFPFSLSAQNNNHFTNLNREDGLTNNFIRTIYQDGYGYMWIGTQSGLNRYDGTQIDQFKKNEENEHSLNSNDINDILFTSSKKLIVGNGSGLNEFNYKTEKFKSIVFLNSTSVSKIVEDKQKNIWIATGNNLVHKFDNDLNRIEDFSFAELLIKKFDVSTSSIRVLKYDAEHFIVHVKDKGFYLFNFISHEFILKTNHVFDINRTMTKVLKIDETEFWLATLSGIFVFKNNDLVHYFKQGSSTQDLNSQFVRDLQKMNKNEIWVFTDGGGINVYNLKTRRFKNIQENARNEFSISSNFLYSSYLTKNGDLWVGSIKKGVSQLIKNYPFETYKLRNLKNGIRSDHPASSLFLDSKDRIWIGSDGNGLYEFKKGRVHHIYSDENIKTIPTINEYFPNYLLLGTYQHGIYSYSTYDNKVTIQSGLHQTINPRKKVSNILKDVNQNVILRSSKTLMIDKVNYNPKRLLEVNDIAIPKNILSSFVDTEKGLTFFGTEEGFYSFENNELKPISNVPKDIKAIIRYNENSFWLATSKGVCLLNVHTSETVFYDLEDGLNTDIINSMVQDNSGDLWCGNRLGVSRFDTKSRKFTNYTYRNGIIDNEFINPAAIKRKDGRLFFGGLNGILAIYPEMINKEKEETHKEVIFTKRLINHENKRERLNELERYIADSKELEFDHTEKVITINFSTFEYENPKNIRFSSKLEGYETEWRETTDRSLTVMNLNHGTYTLKVRASTVTGKFPETESYSSIKIRILPAWWETIWFRIFFAITSLTIIFIGVNFLFRREEYKRNVEFERKSLKDQKALDENQLRFFTNLSHEIRTPLSLIISPIRTIISGERFNHDNSKNLNLIEKNAQRIERLINRGIDFRKTQFKEPELQPQRTDIVAFLRDLVDGFNGLSKVHDIDLNFNNSIPERVIWMDHHMVETIFYNLLSNAFKYCHNNGTISFLISEEENNVIVKVQDNGIGISKEDVQQIFERFFQSKDHMGGSGIGLALTKRFVEAHKGSISVESEKGFGSCFSVILPFGDDQNYTEIKHDNKESRLIKTETIPLNQENETKSLQFKNKSVLIVEDEDNLRDYLKTNLAYNYNVQAVENGKIAYEIIKKENFDIIVSDIMMPVMDGLELCKLLKENSETNSIPVILLSAKTLDKDKIKGYDIGADAYIEKPFHLELLKSQISNLLEKQIRKKNELLELLGVSDSSATLNDSDEKFYAKLISIIEANIGNYDFDIPLFAKEIGMSKSLLYKRMKAVSTVSINDLILNVRLSKSAQLLVHSKESIVNIATMVGFKNAKYFSTSFKKKFNESPSKYRKRSTGLGNKLS